jgi:hypothetical protein
VLKKIFGPKRGKVTGTGEHCMRSFMICTPHQILFGLSNQKELDGQACGMYGAETKGVSRVLVRKPKRKIPLGRGVDGRKTLKWIFKK